VNWDRIEDIHYLANMHGPFIGGTIKF
jgi:hypothetical protein